MIVVRNQLEKDFAGTIKKLAAQGFYQIESMDIGKCHQNKNWSLFCPYPGPCNDQKIIRTCSVNTGHYFSVDLK